MKLPELEVARQCGTCKYFATYDGGYYGKKKQGYCVLGAGGKPIPKKTNLWEDFVAVWNGATADQLLDIGYYPYPTSGAARYEKVKEDVDYWKVYGDSIRTVHRDNVCAGYALKKANTYSLRQINDCSIDWLERLKKGDK